MSFFNKWLSLLFVSMFGMSCVNVVLEQIDV